MIDYIKHLEEYKSYWYSSFSKFIPEEKWGNKEIAKNYLDKYWLSEQEYKNVWKPIQDRIFVNQNDSDLIFAPEYEMIKSVGGCLFLQEDFEQLQKAVIAIGETQMIIIQNTQDFTLNEPSFKMKFPVNITWDELMSGNYISAVLFEMNYNEYFVFGNGCEWGKYCATESENPVDIIGFKSKYLSVFDIYFK